MTAQAAAFAVPGDLAALTGGYGYDRRVLAGLRERGRRVEHIPLAASFPLPSAADNRDAARRLAAIPADCPVIIDGLAFGAMDREALLGMRAPVVALVHHPLACESGLEPARSRALFASERDNLALAAHVIVTSPHTAALLSAEYGVPPGSITVARPGVERCRDHRAPVDPPLILAVGSLVPRKGHDLLLRALARIADRPWRAVIAGAARDEGYRDGLVRLASEPALAERVRLAGSLDAAELARLYRRASLFALATRYEGHGMVFDEAMVRGLPIVSCAAGAVPDTVAPGAGLLVPADDPAAFAGALAQLLDDQERRATMAAAAAAAGAALPDWRETARHVDRVLDRVAARG
jgi:glycosyltransferase involved in cell wall biosynthesis